ncbi:MAG: hypothetical protein LBI05_07875 [Planctomycetaceae bacterium]|jgi:hypothetical protein|nr:hypothetical protein [Planctomycetaceae bacterium]
MSGRVELINADLVTARLLAIPQKIREAVERTALSEANKLAVGRLRANAPSESGALKKSFVYDIRKYKGGNVLAGIVGADYDFVGAVIREPSKNGSKLKFTHKKKWTMRHEFFGRMRRPAKYLHLVELGTGKRQTKAGAG